MNAKDKKDIADIVVAILSAKKQVTQQEKKTPQQEKKCSPHTKEQIPELITTMNPTTCKEILGDITNREPYSFTISKFYEYFNIELPTDKKFNSKNLTLPQKHLVIMQQLKGETKTTVKTQRKRHIDFVNAKIQNPPTHNIYKRELTPTQQEHIVNAWRNELERWNKE